MNNKIVIAHPLQQHSYRTAEGLAEANLLNKYITTVYYREEKIIYKILEKILGKKNVKRMHNRKNNIVEKYLKTFNELLGLIYLFVIRIDKNKIIEPKLYDFLTNIFGKNVYKYIKKNQGRAIVMYDKTAYRCFELLNKKEKCVKILDMSSIAAPYIRKILINELQNEDLQYKSSLKILLKSYTKKRCKKYQKELENTDYFLVASDFTKYTLIDVGIKEEKIIKVPLRNRYIKICSKKV